VRFATVAKILPFDKKVVISSLEKLMLENPPTRLVYA
jgi:hypothetical protein